MSAGRRGLISCIWLELKRWQSEWEGNCGVQRAKDGHYRWRHSGTLCWHLRPKKRIQHGNPGDAQNCRRPRDGLEEKRVHVRKLCSLACGSKKGADLNDWWREVFDIDRLEFYESDIQAAIEHGGVRLTIYKDNDALEQELLSKAPEDAKAIADFMRDVRKLTRFRMPMAESFLSKLISYIRVAPYISLLNRASKITLEKYGKRFKNPLVRSLFEGGVSDLSTIAILFSFGWRNSGNGGYPIGGSLRMIGLIEQNYRKLGGSIRFDSRVKRIIVQDGRATGVELQSGERIDADLVVSAADGYATLFDMLGEQYLDGETKMRFKSLKPFPSYLMVSFGVARKFTGEPEMLSILLDQPISIDNSSELSTASYRIFNFDPNFAPAGKTAIVSFIPTYNYDYWAQLKATSPEKYESENTRCRRSHRCL